MEFPAGIPRLGTIDASGVYTAPANLPYADSGDRASHQRRGQFQERGGAGNDYERHFRFGIAANDAGGTRAPRSHSRQR